MLENFIITLDLMWKGMAAIFLVLGLLSIITALMQKKIK
ncbi:sodium pump decarboxylase gamma subunit [Clostridium sp. Marseille-P299]|nr:sodium pump decarboxylase gamma subunit [Clostridium sp. Marseille-P299]